MSRSFGRDRSALRRRRPSIDPRPRLLVLCEGKVTEPNYLRGLARDSRNNLVEISKQLGVGVPKTLVERASAEMKAAKREARRRQDSFLGYDEVWCVFDVDEHPRLPEAIIQARDNGVNLAVSNPCFELWILLHFRDQNAHLERGNAKHACRHLVPGQKDDVPAMEHLLAGYTDAVRRSTALEERHRRDGTSGENPSTRVHTLTEKIRQPVRPS